MKKVLTAILAIVYLATSSVAAVTMHYCMGKVYAVNFSDNNKCDKCGMQHAKGCCENKVKVLQAQDAHQLVSIEVSFETPAVLIQNVYNLFSNSFFTVAVAAAIHNNSPPGESPSLSILYCVFRL